MNCNGNCPFQNRYYHGPPWANGMSGMPIMSVPPPRENEDPIEYFRRAKRHIKDVEEMFKSEKKDDKPKKKESFTFLETFGLLMVGGPLMAIAQIKLLNYVLSTIPH